MKNEKNLPWIDLEMTGLDPEVDTILEISAIITDSNLNIIAEGPNVIIFCPQEKLNKMDSWVYNTHTKSGLVEQVLKSKISIEEAEKIIFGFFEQYLVQGASPLCGNSIWQDRLFLAKYMPKLNKLFHYRNVDVSTVKELVRRWYGFEFKKSDNHRALEDIRESILELKTYKDKFFVDSYDKV